MDIPSIKTFLVVIEKQSFSLAAESLYLTQPAISKRIASLENELNCQLFDRIKKQIILTEAGRIFLPHAQAIIKQLHHSKNALAAMGGLISGELSMITSHHIGLHHLPPILKRFVSLYPQVTLKLNFMDSESACLAVEKTEVELAVITLPITPPESLNCISIWQDPMKFVVHNDHPLIKQKKSKTNIQLSKKETMKLTQFPAILPEKGTYTRELLEDYFQQSAMNVQVKLSNNYLETIKMMVSVGLGWSILPTTLIDDSLTVLNISDFNAYRSLGLVVHKKRTLTQAAEKMLQLIHSSNH